MLQMLLSLKALKRWLCGRKAAYNPRLSFATILEFPMVVIRLARGGAKHRPFYNMVVADSRDPRDGRFIERVGFYDPKAPAGREALRVDVERVKHWKGVGAQLSPTVTRLVKQFSRGVSANAPKAA
jgi:small subunit ribosomal protein S16